MNASIRALVPYAHVQNVASSIDFYSKLGFRVTKTFTPPGSTRPSWAWLESGEAKLMLASASHPIVASEQAIILVLYVDDVAAKHDELAALGLSIGVIEYPIDAPRGVFRLSDPDGYDLTIRHA